MKNVPPLPLIDNCLFVDNSMLELLTTCPRALEYSQLHKRIIASDKPSLVFGGAIHDALEYRYLRYAATAPDPYCLEAQRAILGPTFEAKPPPIDDWRTFQWALTVLEKYNERYGNEPFQLLAYDTPIPCPRCHGTGSVEQTQEEATWGITPCIWCDGSGKRSVMVEMPFALPLYTKRLEDGREVIVMYSGRIDLPTKEDGALFITDHKTTSMLGNQFFERAAMLAAQLGYCWSYWKLTGVLPQGYRINAIRVKEPPQYIQGPRVQTLDDTAPAPKGRKALDPDKWWQESLQREKFYVSQSRLEEWHSNTIELCEEFFWHYQRDYFPMKTAWCCMFGKCQYYDVCALPAKDRGVMLHSTLFTNNTWSPLRHPSQPIV